MNFRFFLCKLIFFVLLIDCLRAAPASPSSVLVNGRKIILQRRLPNNTLSSPITFTINGVDWNPVPVGSTAAAWSTYYVQDLTIISNMHASVIRTYGPLPQNSTGLAVLDYCYDHNIYVIMNVGYSTDTSVAAAVNYFKNHPAILMFEVGNEWNYNFGYGNFGSTIADCAIVVQRKAGVIKSNDSNHPVTSSLGSAYDSTPFKDGVFTTCSNVDVWGFNTYLKDDASAAVTAAAAYSTKPYYFSELGTDAFNEITMQEDQVNQAKYCLLHWTSVKNKNQLTINGGGFSGEIFFEFSDEWWKDSNGTKTAHDNGGGSGPFYDSYGNSEWWGLVDVNRNQRQVCTSLQTAWAGLNTITDTDTSVPAMPVWALTTFALLLYSVTGYFLRQRKQNG